jgi:hypothetical protein
MRPNLVYFRVDGGELFVILNNENHYKVSLYFWSQDKIVFNANSLVFRQQFNKNVVKESASENPQNDILNRYERFKRKERNLIKTKVHCKTGNNIKCE